MTLDNPRQKIIGEGCLLFNEEGFPSAIKYLCDVINVEGEEFSFPFNFEYNGKHFCIPERTVWKGGEKEHPLALYVKESTEWCKQKDIGVYGVDPVLIKGCDAWFLIASNNSEVGLYVCEDLLHGDFKKHPLSPIAKSSKFKRMAGGPLIQDESIYLFWQDCSYNYGYGVRVTEVLELSKEKFKQKEHSASPIMTAQFNGEWNNDGMHHIDFSKNRRVAIVDGHKKSKGWKLALIKNIGGVEKITITRKPPLINVAKTMLRIVASKSYRLIKRVVKSLG